MSKFQGKEPRSKAKAAFGLLLAFIPMGCPMIGINLSPTLGLIVFALAFVFAVYGLLVWNKISEWTFGRKAIGVLAFTIIYFGLIGHQVSKLVLTQGQAGRSQQMNNSQQGVQAGGDVTSSGNCRFTGINNSGSIGSASVDGNSIVCDPATGDKAIRTGNIQLSSTLYLFKHCLESPDAWETLLCRATLVSEGRLELGNVGDALAQFEYRIRPKIELLPEAQAVLCRKEITQVENLLLKSGSALNARIAELRETPPTCVTAIRQD